MNIYTFFEQIRATRAGIIAGNASVTVHRIQQQTDSLIFVLTIGLVGNGSGTGCY